jgi:hypothetical protein
MVADNHDQYYQISILLVNETFEIIKCLKGKEIPNSERNREKPHPCEKQNRKDGPPKGFLTD